MNQYLLILLISISTCALQKVLLNKEILPVNEIKTYSQAKEAVDYTFCIRLKESEDFQKIFEELKSTLPDDISEEEVIMAICQKLMETEEISTGLNNLAKDVGSIKKLYKPDLMVKTISNEIVLTGFWSKLKAWWNDFGPTIVSIGKFLIEVFTAIF